MPFIHKQPFNFIVRNVLHPFRKIIPSKYYFAIDGTIVVQLTEEKRMLFNANATSNLLRVLFWMGIEGFEFNEYKIFTQLIKQSKCFFDIGANIGYYSVVAKIFNPTIDVYGFEPLPGACKYFHKNILLNKLENINVQQIALCDKTGTAKFYSNINPRFRDIMEDHLYGNNSLNEAVAGNTSRVEFDVKTDTLDNYVKSNLPSGKIIDMIKMDTEGTENLVLAGGKEVLKTHRPIIMCEVIKGAIEKEIERVLSDVDYLYYEVTELGLKRAPSLNPQNAKDDYFFVPKEKKNKVERFEI